MNKLELQDRTKDFAIRIFKLVEQFPKSKASDVVVYQLLKSASSVAANYRAVNRSKSKPDFENKLKIVCEEADESHFWLTFIEDISLITKNQELDLLIKESDELTAIFTAALKTVNKSNSLNLKS